MADTTKLLIPPYIIDTIVRGSAHVSTNTPCQDAYAFTQLGDTLIIAVADGLGSAAMSDHGADLAVATAVQYIADFLTTHLSGSHKDILSMAAKTVHETLKREAENTGISIRDLATTLIITIVSPSSVTAAHIGDGAVVIKTRTTLQILSGPDDDAYANEVVPITSDAWESYLKINECTESIYDIAVFTDGCQRAAIRKDPSGMRAFEGFFSPLFSHMETLTDPVSGKQDLLELLESDQICESSQDDKTMVIGIVARQK